MASPPPKTSGSRLFASAPRWRRGRWFGLRWGWLAFGLPVALVALVLLGAFTVIAFRTAAHEDARRTAFAEIIVRRRRETGADSGSLRLPLAPEAWDGRSPGAFFAEATNALPPGEYRYVVRPGARPPTFIVFDSAHGVITEGPLPSEGRPAGK